MEVITMIINGKAGFSLAKIGIDTNQLARVTGITGNNAPYFPLVNVSSVIDTVKDVIEISDAAQVITYLKYDPDVNNADNKMQLAFWIDYSTGNTISYVEISLDNDDKAYLLDIMAKYIMDNVLSCDGEPIDITEYEKVN